MTISLVQVIHAKLAEAGKCHVPFLTYCWEPGAYGWKKRPGSIYCREGTHSTFQQNPAGFYTFIHSTHVESCILNHKNMRTYILLFLHFQTSQSGMFCLREGNHLGSYSFIQKTGTILTSSKCCEKVCIKFKC